CGPPAARSDRRPQSDRPAARCKSARPFRGQPAMTAGAADDLPPGGTRLTHSPDPFLAILAYYGRELALTLDPTRIYELALDGAQTLTSAQAALLCTRESGGPGRLLLSHNVDPALESALCALSPPTMRGTTLTMV